MELLKTVKNLKVNLLKEVCDESAARLDVARPINVLQGHIDDTVSRFEQGYERLEQIELSWRDSVEKIADGWRDISPLSEKFNSWISRTSKLS